MHRFLILFLLLPISAFAAKLPDTPQSGVFFNGAHHAVVWSDAGTPKIKFQHRDSSSFGNNLTLNLPTVSDGDDLSVAPLGKLIPTSWATFSGGTTTEISRGYKVNNSDTVGEWSTYNPGTTRNNPSITATADYLWAAWVDGSNNIQVARSTAVASYTQGTLTLSTPTTVKTSGAWPQLVHREKYWTEDLGILYSFTDTTSKLEYRPYTAATTTWGTAETVETGLDSLTSFRGVTCRNGDLYVIFRKSSDDKLYYIVRSGGSWGSATLINDDTAYAGDGYFTATANLGADESVYVVYFDSTNLVRREITGSGVSSKTTVVSSPTFANGNIQAPYDAVDEYLIAYEDSANAIQTAEITLTYTPAVSGTGLEVIGHVAGSYALNGQNSRYMQSYNGKTLILFTTYSGESMVNVMDESSGTFDHAWTYFTNYPYYDQGHNALTCFIDNSGYVYVAEGGRYADSANYKIYKSDFTIDHASFTFDKTNDWTDISPPANSSGRGYKAILVDQDNVIYLLAGLTVWNGVSQSTFSNTYHITEYRSGAWSTPVKFIDYTGSIGSASNDNIYVTGFTLGEETSGQKSLHVFYGMRAEETAAYSGDWRDLGLVDVQYVKIIPDGDGTFTFNDSSGGALTVPLTYTNGDMVYDQWGTLYPPENLTTYTEGDPNAEVTVTSSTVVHSQVGREDTSTYVYKDMGAGYFNGRYKIRWSSKMTGAEGTTNAIFAHLTLSESPTNMFEVSATNNVNGITIGWQRVYNAGNPYVRIIAWHGNGTTKTIKVLGGTGDADYGLNVSWWDFELIVDTAAGTITLTPYDPGTDVIAGGVIEWTGVTIDNYRYIYAFSPYNTGTGSWTSGESKNYVVSTPDKNLNIVGNLGWSDMVDASTPVLGVPMYAPGNKVTPSSAETTGYYFFKYDGAGGWDRSTINTTNVPSTLGWNNSTRISRVGTGTFFSVSEVEESGVKKIAHTRSSSSGDTWNAVTVVPSSYSANDAFVARTSTTKGRVIYAAETNYLTTEIVTFTMQIGTIKMNGVQVIKINGVTPVDLN